MPDTTADTIELVPYDARWPALFKSEQQAIRAALGPDIEASIVHIGSTAVPGLPAKPIIDILLQVRDSADEPAYVPAMLGLGYRVRVREPAWLEHRVLSKRVEHGDPHSVNVHVLSPQHGAVEIDRMLRFRDWLRALPAENPLANRRPRLVGISGS
jgi:GrpB-like predicted nucleotidyltransferase (UPF0157 family)